VSAAPYIDAQRRSAARSRSVLLRMSEAEREALQAAAEARGTSVTELVHEALAPYMRPQHSK
jgi:uncharacterized protein (DUF1778 family)